MQRLPIDLLPELEKSQENKLLTLLSDDVDSPSEEELKLKFWRKVITALCLHKRTLSVKLSDIDLSVRGVQPDSLSRSLSKLHETNNIMTRTSIHDRAKESNAADKKGGLGQLFMGTIFSLFGRTAPSPQALMDEELVVEFLLDKCAQIIVNSVETDSVVCFVVNTHNTAITSPTSSTSSSPYDGAVSNASSSSSSSSLSSSSSASQGVLDKAVKGDDATTTLSTTIPSSGSALTFRDLLIFAAKKHASDDATTYMQDLLLNLKPDDVTLLIDFMVLSGRAMVSPTNANVIKVLGSKLVNEAQASQDGVNLSKHHQVNETDLARLQLNFAIENVKRRTAQLQSQIDEHFEQAKAHKRNKNDVGALIQLKMRKTKTQELERWQKVHFQLDSNLMSLEGAEMNKIVMEAFTQATIGLRSTREGITVESVEDAFEAFNEEMENQREISEALTSGQTNDAIDQDELEAELATMMAEMNFSSSNAVDNNTSNTINTINSSNSSSVSVRAGVNVAASLPSVPTVTPVPAATAQHAPPSAAPPRKMEEALM